ncbi:uncharacterized protein [Typha angustifolia]|uniref:uncharacterized protein n=1 Tax=Typha angustifolia TaxID=59011 RepID=UPI003C2DB2E4
MKEKTNGSMQRAHQLKHIQREGPNWVFIAGGALLSTLSIRLACKLKQIFEAKQSDITNKATKERGKTAARRRSGTCQVQSNLYCYIPEEDGCYDCSSDVALDLKLAHTNPMPKEADVSLPLVKIATYESNNDSTVMWSSSPDLLELPQKPFYQSNSSDSPCVSESGSDIYTKREVIQKLRQQLRRRDEMIAEMQAQITDLRSSLSIQMTHSADLQTQLDSANRDLFDSERQVQLLRKVIADHCVAEAGSPEKTGSSQSWRLVTTNGHANGYLY